MEMEKQSFNINNFDFMSIVNLKIHNINEDREIIQEQKMFNKEKLYLNSRERLYGQCTDIHLSFSLMSYVSVRSLNGVLIYIKLMVFC